MIAVAAVSAVAVLACGDDEVAVVPSPPAGLTPQVEGRLVGRIFADFAADGSSVTILCESDAIVVLEGRVVKQVIRHGDRPKVELGDEVAESLEKPPREGVLPRETGQSGDQIFDYVKVYWGDDGRLHVGCAPESVRQ